MRYIITIRTLCTILLLTISAFTQAQTFEPYQPLDIPLLLSGNFGELRSTHFHAGIDLKTQSVTGKKVHSLESGYVSRVKIQSGGYGRAIYITHKNGYTSVYGHLQEFFPELELYIKKEQYKLKQYEIDLYFKSDKFPVSKGQIIAESGNSGSSGGPHLHLEIRDKNQVPLNGLRFGFNVEDSLPPVFKRLFVYNNLNQQFFSYDSKDKYSVLGSKKKFYINKPVNVNEFAGLGIEVYDYLNGSSNRCGIYTIRFYLDDKLYYSSKIDAIAFDVAKYIKTHMDYEEKIKNKVGVHRLFFEPNNKLNIYKTIFNQGILQLKDSTIYKARIIATDVYGNESVLSFKVYCNHEKSIPIAADSSIIFYYKKENVFKNENVRFSMSSYSLFSDKKMTYSSARADHASYSDFHTFGNEMIPTIKYPHLELKVTKDFDGVKPEKFIIVRKNIYNGKLVCEGGYWKNGWVTAKVKGFGQYFISADTVAPVIRPVSFRQNAWYGDGNTLSFKITDDISGIKTYNGYIDENWALFEYDAKSNSLSYKIDKEKIVKTKKAHDVKLYIMDERNNVQVFEGKFYY